MNDERVFLVCVCGGRVYSEEAIAILKWNLVFMFISDVDRKWPTVEVMVYIETLWETGSSSLEPLNRL